MILDTFNRVPLSVGVALCLFVMGCDGRKKPAAFESAALKSVEPSLLKALAARDFDRAFKLVEPFAQRGDADAQLAVAAFLILKASALRSAGAQEAQLKQVEEHAILWITRSAGRGNGIAKGILRDIKRSGKDAIYTLPLEHLIPEADRPEPVPLIR